MKNDALLHTQGLAHFIDDLPHPEGLLHATVFSASIAHGEITQLDLAAAKAITGVSAIFTAADIQGKNQIGTLVEDECLLTEKDIDYIGQPIALIIAQTLDIANQACALIHCEYQEKPAIFDARAAYQQGAIHAPAKQFTLGDVDSIWQQCDVVLTGTVNSGAQEHIYLETQSALALPLEQGSVKVYASTQSPSSTQRIIAQVLGCAMHQVEVDVLRLGGGFGGKEEQATRWATFAALAAVQLQRPVKCVLSRQQDMQLTGKRHPYTSDFKIGLSQAGKILGYQVFFYQNAGATNDLSPSILERSLFHSTNSYFIPHVHASAVSCKTNLMPNTAFRGFGGPQAMFVIESAIYQAAQALNMSPAAIQKKNLLQEGDSFPYHMLVEHCQARKCWQQLEQSFDIQKQQQAIDLFNQQHQWQKKALSFMPVCFAISFNTTFLNQARALVHIYTDGSVSVSTGAVEMGQGVKMKLRQIAASSLGIALDKIKVETTSTMRISNMSPTSASVGADLNGHATQIACEKLLQRLLQVAAQSLKTAQDSLSLQHGFVYQQDSASDLSWLELINSAYLQRINLSEQAHYATPNLRWDWHDTQKNSRPFAYHAFGTAITEVSLDCLLGTYEIDRVSIVHDVGNSLNPLIDRGQIEGGLVQGIGWMTLEDIQYDTQGHLLNDSLASYKIPDIYFVPDIEVQFLDNAENPHGLRGSKAVAEPPFMYGIGSYFALLNAMRAFNPNLSLPFDAPLTPEKILSSLHHL